MRRVACVLAACCLSACTMLIIHAPKNPMGEPPVDMLPLPDGTECPLEATAAQPVAHLIVFTRTDRGLTSMASTYDALLSEIVTRIRDRGVLVSHELVAAYDPGSQA